MEINFSNAWLIWLAAFLVIGLICFVIYEMNHAIEVEPKKPFLFGDYDPSKDPTLEHTTNYCNNCKWLSKDNNKCRHFRVNGNITDAKVEECKMYNYFTEKDNAD